MRKKLYTENKILQVLACKEIDSSVNKILPGLYLGSLKSMIFK